MDRRKFLLGAAGVVATISGYIPALASPGNPLNQTRWKVRTSVGFDAIAFLGPLAGGALYREHYGDEADAFSPRLSRRVREDIPALWREAEKDGFGLLGPNLQVLFSSGDNDRSLDSLLAALRAKDSRILPSYRNSLYWSETDWAWFVLAAPRLEAIFENMRAADFDGFRQERTRGLGERVGELQQALDGYDVIGLQTKLTGRVFGPTIEVVLLRFAKPHGIKVQGQVFLQASDYDTATTVRIAAHEMLHPPFDKKGPAAQAAISIFRRDPTIMSIVRDHDPRWGYMTLEGLLDEDIVQALDQLISEALGVARNPADRWRKADDGMHVLAGGFYGMLRDDRWVERGGSIESWIEQVAAAGRLEPSTFHAVAARVLERPVDHLWPLVRP